MDVLSQDTGIGLLDRFDDLFAGRSIVHVHGSLGGLVDDLLGQQEISHVALVGPGDAKRPIEDVENCEWSRLATFREAGGVLQRIDGGTPYLDAVALCFVVKGFPAIAFVVEETRDTLVHPPGHLRSRVDSAKTQLWVRAHLGRLPELRHQAFTETDEHRVVLG